MCVYWVLCCTLLSWFMGDLITVPVQCQKKMKKHIIIRCIYFWYIYIYTIFFTSYIIVKWPKIVHHPTENTNPPHVSTLAKALYAASSVLLHCGLASTAAWGASARRKSEEPKSNLRRLVGWSKHWVDNPGDVRSKPQKLKYKNVGLRYVEVNFEYTSCRFP